MTGRIASINVSSSRGERKIPRDSVRFVAGVGIEGDVHAGSSRQLSLLALEGIRGFDEGLKPGDFAENITTEGLDLLSLPIGTCLKVGASVVIRITAHRKICHAPCNIFKKHGRCIMPEEGAFAEVLVGGDVKTGDALAILDSEPSVTG